MFNLHRQLRFAGSLILMGDYFLRSFPLLCLGFYLLAVGVIGGVSSLEDRVRKLEPKPEESNEKDETK